MGYYYDKMIELNADGIDFIPIGDLLENNTIKRIVKTITKQDFENGKVDCIPKTGYRFWRMENGQKVYIV